MITPVLKKDFDNIKKSVSSFRRECFVLGLKRVVLVNSGFIYFSVKGCKNYKTLFYRVKMDKG